MLARTPTLALGRRRRRRVIRRPAGFLAGFDLRGIARDMTDDVILQMTADELLMHTFRQTLCGELGKGARAQGQMLSRTARPSVRGEDGERALRLSRGRCLRASKETEGNIAIISYDEKPGTQATWHHRTLPAAATGSHPANKAPWHAEPVGRHRQHRGRRRSRQFFGFRLSSRHCYQGASRPKSTNPCLLRLLDEPETYQRLGAAIRREAVPLGRPIARRAMQECDQDRMFAAWGRLLDSGP
jgi:hypothetical protein